MLCNACGLFLKLHGRPRPISLKTDVIKSRNRVKTTLQSQKKKVISTSSILCYGIEPIPNIAQPSFDTNGPPPMREDARTSPVAKIDHRRTSQQIFSAASERSHSPISRTNTPSLQHDPNIAPQHLFDGAALNDHPFHPSPSLPGLPLGHHSPGSTSSLNDRHLEPPQTYDQLLTANNQLKTRVNELEVINIMIRESENRLRTELEMIQRKEEDLKRSLEKESGDEVQERSPKRLRETET